MEHLLQGLNGVDATEEISEWSSTASGPCRHMSALRMVLTAAPICQTSAIGRRREDSGSCIHLFASWLL